MTTDLDAAMRAIADSLSGPSDMQDVLMWITTAAVDTVPEADYASITVRHRDMSVETTAASSDLPRRLDQVQYELREGPCYESVTDDEDVVYAAHMRDDDRWPDYGLRAAELGVHSQVAIQLQSLTGRVTSLNFYSEADGAFDDDRALPQLFASHARVALGFATELATLRGAVGTREMIGKAIGVIMFKYGLSSERAFEFLIRLSQTTNQKLRDVAARVVADTGQGKGRSSGA